MEPVWIFDYRYRYRSKKDRPDRTGRSTGSTGLPVTGRSTGHDRSTGDRPFYLFFSSFYRINLFKTARS